MYVDVNCLAFCWSRASDKKRNLAQQKAEAQRRLYGHGSMKKLSAASSDWEKQRHTLERRREELVRTSRKKEKAGGEQKSIHLNLFFKFTNTGLYIHSVTHIVPPETQVKPQISEALAGIKLQGSICDAKHLYKVVLLNCGRGSWERSSFISPPGHSKPAWGLKQWVHSLKRWS